MSSENKLYIMDARINFPVPTIDFKKGIIKEGFTEPYLLLDKVYLSKLKDKMFYGDTKIYQQQSKSKALDLSGYGIYFRPKRKVFKYNSQKPSEYKIGLKANPPKGMYLMKFIPKGHQLIVDWELGIARLIGPKSDNEIVELNKHLIDKWRKEFKEMATERINRVRRRH